MRRFSFATVFIAAFVFMPFCTAQATQPKRPMTFEDMMKMKRLGETAVSPDSKWLAYSVTTVDLNQNTKTAELWMQAIARAAGVYPDRAARTARHRDTGNKGNGNRDGARASSKVKGQVCTHLLDR